MNNPKSEEKEYELTPQKVVKGTAKGCLKIIIAVPEGTPTTPRGNFYPWDGSCTTPKPRIPEQYYPMGRSNTSLKRRDGWGDCLGDREIDRKWISNFGRLPYNLTFTEENNHG